MSFLVFPYVFLLLSVNGENETLIDEEQPPWYIATVFILAMCLAHLYYFVQFTDYSMQYIHSTSTAQDDNSKSVGAVRLTQVRIDTDNTKSWAIKNGFFCGVCVCSCLCLCKLRKLLSNQITSTIIKANTDFYSKTSYHFKLI